MITVGYLIRSGVILTVLNTLWFAYVAPNNSISTMDICFGVWQALVCVWFNLKEAK